MRITLHIDAEMCKGCGLCIAACPRGILRISTRFNSSGQHFVKCADPGACSGCRQCAIMCPDAAIEIERIAADARPRPAGKRQEAGMEEAVQEAR